MICKECIYKKDCTIKKAPPKECFKFLKYEDTKEFYEFDRMIRENKGIQLS